MRHACGPAWFKDFPDLSGVLTQCETQEDADPGWLADVREQAGRFLASHGGKLTPDTRELLALLATAA